MTSDLQLLHLAFNRVKELSLKYGDSIPYLILFFQRTCPHSLLTIFISVSYDLWQNFSNKI
ncbi:hypothetical protein CXF95_21685 [Paraglaciecola sp. MB-3u-78]|nr:hypothetical protein CXF95_21685 [Paraglaciecola sp. MB-3u-78]